MYTNIHLNMYTNIHFNMYTNIHLSMLNINVYRLWYTNWCSCAHTVYQYLFLFSPVIRDVDTWHTRGGFLLNTIRKFCLLFIYKI